MIDRGEGSRDQKQAKKDNLRIMIAYCENQMDCRRQVVLEYFGEKFNRFACQRTCDNCAAGLKFITKNMTEDAKAIVEFVKSLRDDERYTLIHCQDVYRGSKNAKVMSAGHNQSALHGKGKFYFYFIFL